MTFEYSLVQGVNDNLDEGAQAGGADSGSARACESDSGQSDQGSALMYGGQDGTIEAFKGCLQNLEGINVTIPAVRWGVDIDGACGQLRKSYG